MWDNSADLGEVLENFYFLSVVKENSSYQEEIGFTTEYYFVQHMNITTI